MSKEIISYSVTEVWPISEIHNQLENKTQYFYSTNNAYFESLAEKCQTKKQNKKF